MTNETFASILEDIVSFIQYTLYVCFRILSFFRSLQASFFLNILFTIYTIQLVQWVNSIQGYNQEVAFMGRHSTVPPDQVLFKASLK